MDVAGERGGGGDADANKSGQFGSENTGADGCHVSLTGNWPSSNLRLSAVLEFAGTVTVVCWLICSDTVYRVTNADVYINII